MIPAILDGVRSHRAAVVVAAPGAGKTTRVPPALSAAGPVLLLQPRRIAARTIARRIADEQRWTLGQEVGWHVRFERHFSARTRLLVATEGILTARLQQDPLLSDFRTVVLDEFHERSIHADLGIALVKQAWIAREDLTLVVMSATLDAQRVATYLDDCPVFDVPGTPHRVEIAYRPGLPPSDACREALTRTTGQILLFMPGAPEVRRTADAIRRSVANTVEVVELHGSLAAEEQDGAIMASHGRRIIVATNIAETSLTVPGVSAVVDSGQHKVARYDAARAVDSLELERISRDAADQRAGRAGRLGPGIVLRLWDEAARLRPHREPDVHRMDLSGPVLAVRAWGGDPGMLDWFDRPLPDALAAATELLRAIGAIEGDQLTGMGHAMARLSVHPRLARILIEADGAHEAALACAMLSDRQLLPQHPATTTCDLLTGVEGELPPHILRNARELQRGFRPASRRLDESSLRRALLSGYPDRVAQRRSPGDPRVLLASGHGAVIGAESGVRDGEFVLALEVQAARRGDTSEARIRIASIVDKSWLTPTAVQSVQHVDEPTGMLRIVQQEMYGGLILKARAVKTDASREAAHLADAFLARPFPDDDAALVLRLRFAGLDVDARAIALHAASGRRTLNDMRLEDGLDWRTRQRLDECAPVMFTAPSGRSHRLEYRPDGSVALSIKLQELFGLATTPFIGARREPLLLLLLAPNGRPVQTTRDLKSFWDTTYPQVRRELRGRYPKHPWPENPWDAIPTARMTKRTRRS